MAKLNVPNKKDMGKKKRYLNIELLDEKWFRQKVAAAYDDTYQRFDTDRLGHTAVWAVWKRRLLNMWCSESEIRRDKNKSELELWSRLYEEWLKKEQNRQPGQAPQNPNVGKRLASNLKKAKEDVNRTKYRRIQELSTKEFYKRYKTPHGMQWIDKLDVTPNWDTALIQGEKQEQ